LLFWGESFAFYLLCCLFSVACAIVKSKPCPFWGESFAKAQGGLLGRVLCKSKGKAKVKSPQEHLGEFKQRLNKNKERRDKL